MVRYRQEKRRPGKVVNKEGKKDKTAQAKRAEKNTSSGFYYSFLRN